MHRYSHQFLLLELQVNLLVDFLELCLHKLIYGTKQNIPTYIFWVERGFVVRHYAAHLRLAHPSQSPLSTHSESHMWSRLQGRWTSYCCSLAPPWRHLEPCFASLKTLQLTGCRLLTTVLLSTSYRDTVLACAADSFRTCVELLGGILNQNNLISRFHFPVENNIVQVIHKQRKTWKQLKYIFSEKQKNNKYYWWHMF